MIQKVTHIGQLQCYLNPHFLHNAFGHSSKVAPTLWPLSQKTTRKCACYPERRERDREQGGVEWKSEKENVVKLSCIHILAQIQTSDYLEETSGRTRVQHEADKRQQKNFPYFGDGDLGSKNKVPGQPVSIKGKR